ncbi:cytidine deaminase [Turneriella parva]|uniref:Cytidine deaminase n=1 Tax=Turneriella parva (strain ATCC BAA-1111 / DSM 21527 / NCTC 11395 / H) TaxID=869212 RepID=I4B6Y8_TURPD|nr:cytidine deaminase [Turneriella parva]AFM13045.1 cytidine deaminase [Turneriella parva DSM 21527]
MKTNPLTKQAITELREQAIKASNQAYAPYSGIHVGAALLASDGNVYLGCNVENASYGLTICAERSAVSAAMQKVTEKRGEMIRAIYIVNNKVPEIPPCGACRQVLFEFGKGGIVYFDGKKGMKKMLIDKILPEAFRL